MSGKNISKAKRKDGTVITVDLDLCIAAGPCGVIAPDTFAIRDGDGKAVISDPEGHDLQTIMDAAKSCPVKAILLKDRKGKTLI